MEGRGEGKGRKERLSRAIDDGAELEAAVVEERGH
jgi:hypothetical protein